MARLNELAWPPTDLFIPLSGGGWDSKDSSASRLQVHKLQRKNIRSVKLLTSLPFTMSTLEFLTNVAIIVYHCYSASGETVRFLIGAFIPY